MRDPKLRNYAQLTSRNDIRRRTNNDKVNNISLGAVYLDTRVSNVAYNLRFYEYINVLEYKIRVNWNSCDISINIATRKWNDITIVPNVRGMSDYIRFFSTFFFFSLYSSHFTCLNNKFGFADWHYDNYFNSQILPSIFHSFWIVTYYF